jgi:MFS family permease
VLGSAVGGALLLAALVVVELRQREPMIDLRLLGDRLFRVTNLVSLFGSASFLGLLFVAPLFLQEGRGVSAFTSGLTTFPEALGVVLSTQIVARLYPLVGPRRLIAGGLTWVAIMMALLCLMEQDTTLWLMRLLMFFTGAGMAYMFLSMQAAAFATISSAATGRASALFSAQRQLGAALGVALLSAILTAVGSTQRSLSGSSIPNLAAYHAAFLAAAVLALIGASIALGVSDRAAAPTMQRRARKGESADMPSQGVQAQPESSLGH